MSAYSETVSYIRDAIVNLEDGEYDEAKSNMSFAEAYLPIDSPEVNEDIERSVSRYCTLVSAVERDNYGYTVSEQKYVNKLIEAGARLIGSILTDCDYYSVLYRELNNIGELLETTGELERLPEDSPWGSIVKSYLNNE